MQSKGDSTDDIRVSVSSAPSTSSNGSGQDDTEAFGDVYVWGEVIYDSYKSNNDRNSSINNTRKDILQPKPLESNVVLDIHNVACGVNHAALVTRQGELFTWGEGSGGRLGHGLEADAVHPLHVETLSAVDIEFIACGEFHTCAVSTSGELYTWGDGAYKAGLLGHGTVISHWIPRRVSGPLEGIQVSSVSCGTWHTALITLTGQLFTFGDGTFGALGHGNRESEFHPREVESLIGLKTIAVSCGVWHTAAVVEVISSQSSASSGKLFTWGDGDKYRLGHGDKEPRLKPTCVPSLIEYIFHKIACGHSLTVGLTISGDVFAMGSTVYGQLGNPHSDGKLPCLVQDKLANEFVKEIACGFYHVAVLTSRNEVYTWGKGANGRLGHGDIEDRTTPTVVEGLKDRPVKHIACGANFTAAVCQHKWVSTEQSLCTACRQTFGFTRKRHNCYNCGLIHCHSCSSKKSLRAALAPISGKPYRVCDSCYMKLNRVTESSKINDKKNALPRFLGDGKKGSNKADLKGPMAVSPSSFDSLDLLDTKAAKPRKKSDALSLIRSQQNISTLQIRDVASYVGADLQLSNPRLTYLSAVQSIIHSNTVSPFSQKPSRPSSVSPIPTTSGRSSSKSIAVSLKKTNEVLNQEIQKLRGQVDSFRQLCKIQEYELQKSATKVQEATVLATEELTKHRAAKDVIKSLTQQLKDMAEGSPPVHSIGLAGLQKQDAIQPDFRKEASSAQRSGGTNEGAGSKHIGNGLESNVKMENGLKPRSPTSIDNPVEAEWIEQYEAGVYITLIALKDGSRDLKRVRFSRRRFGEQQAEKWWSEHRHQVYEKFGVRRLLERSSSALSAHSAG